MSFAWKKTPLLVPPRQKLAGIQACVMLELRWSWCECHRGAQATDQSRSRARLDRQRGDGGLAPRRIAGRRALVPEPSEPLRDAREARPDPIGAALAGAAMQ